MKRKGFTIVELLVVIAILGILLGIISNAAMGAIRNSRVNRAQAMQKVLEQAIAAYYAQQGEWPGALNSISRNFNPPDGQDYVELSASETDTVFREIVKKSVGASASMPLIDVSALFVAKSSDIGNNGEGCLDVHDRSKANNCAGRGCINGIDFSEAVKKGGKHNIQINQMAFGYQGKTEGKFRRYWIRYFGGADMVEVVRK